MVQEAIKKLEELGRMPDESENNLSNQLIDEYAQMIDNAKKPINIEEAKALIKLFPESGLFGVEWSLLHLFETILGHISIDDYKKLIEECPSQEWKDTLLKRLKNKIGNTAPNRSGMRANNLTDSHDQHAKYEENGQLL